jgi:hypothetical protein
MATMVLNSRARRWNFVLCAASPGTLAPSAMSLTDDHDCAGSVARLRFEPGLSSRDCPLPS